MHFLDPEWRLRHFMLGCVRLTGSHTWDRIFGCVKALIDKFGIRKKVAYVGTDNGSNVIKAFCDWMPGFVTRDEFEQVYGSTDLQEQDEDVDGSDQDDDEN